MAQTATTLAWGALQYREAYEAAGQMGWMLDCLKWATDYFLKCHSAENELYAQVSLPTDRRFISVLPGGMLT